MITHFLCFKYFKEQAAQGETAAWGVKQEAVQDAEGGTRPKFYERKTSVPKESSNFN